MSILNWSILAIAVGGAVLIVWIRTNPWSKRPATVTTPQSTPVNTTLRKVPLGLLFGGAFLLVAIWIGIQSLQNQEGHKTAERCETYVWEEVCTPRDTVFTKVLRAGSVETVVVPPYYRLDWWGSCGEYRSEQERVGILLLVNLNTAPQVDSTTVYFHLFIPEDSNQKVEVTCDEQNVPPKEDEVPPKERSDPHTV